VRSTKKSVGKESWPDLERLRAGPRLVRPEQGRKSRSQAIAGVARERCVIDSSDFGEKVDAEEDPNAVEGNGLGAGEAGEGTDYFHEAVIPLAKRGWKRVGDFLDQQAGVDGTEKLTDGREDACSVVEENLCGIL
jgi:hypothetical protein